MLEMTMVHVRNQGNRFEILFDRFYFFSFQFITSLILLTLVYVFILRFLAHLVLRNYFHQIYLLSIEKNVK